MDHEMYVTQDLNSSRDTHSLTRATLKKPELTSSQCTWFHYEDLHEFTIMKHCTQKCMSTLFFSEDLDLSATSEDLTISSRCTAADCNTRRG